MDRKARLRLCGVTYNQVARLAGVSWSMVYKVCAGLRVSAKVDAAINALCPVEK